MRLVAVIAVLVGLALLHSPRCADGMIATGSMAHSGGSGMAAGGVQGCADPVAAANTPVRTGNSLPGAGDMGGILATCLTFLVMVLVAISVLCPAWLRIVVTRRVPERRAMIRPIWLQAPSLAELCVLRT